MCEVTEEFIEIIDEEFERLCARGFALINAETKESIEEWLLFDAARMEQTQQSDKSL